MAFNNDLEGLINSLYRPSIFYVPKSLFPTTLEESRQELLDYRVIEAVAVLKVNGSISYSDKCFPEIELLKKTTNLENNIFQLHKYKDQLKIDSFNFIKNKYLQNVSACEYVYTWLLDNIGKDIDYVTDSEKKLFEYQKSLVKKHAEKLKSIFSIGQNSKKVNLTNFLTNNPNLFKDNKYTQVINNSLNNKNKSTNSLKNKNYKITNQEADMYLLKTVFSLDFSKSIK